MTEGSRARERAWVWATEVAGIAGVLPRDLAHFADRSRRPDEADHRPTPIDTRHARDEGRARGPGSTRAANAPGVDGARLGSACPAVLRGPLVY
ncbi:hypothetical protein [Singulisphaera sp. PoT]|uniref:hypothetical protein n=1 Tax=Singulisphaera sp. PoT TaxID=3411797 RepID=UPI003BF4896E